MAACSRLSPRQQDYLINFIWLCAHAPERTASRMQRRLLDVLESDRHDDEQITAALRQAVAELKEILSKASGAREP